MANLFWRCDLIMQPHAQDLACLLQERSKHHLDNTGNTLNPNPDIFPETAHCCVITLGLISLQGQGAEARGGGGQPEEQQQEAQGG